MLVLVCYVDLVFWGFLRLMGLVGGVWCLMLWFVALLVVGVAATWGFWVCYGCSCDCLLMRVFGVWVYGALAIGWLF